MTRRQTRSSPRQQRERRACKRIRANAAWEPTAVSQLFEGRLSSTSVCARCDHQARGAQSFTVLSLAIPPDPIKRTIQVLARRCGPLSAPASDVLPHALCSAQDCLSLFFDQTTLSGGEHMLCSACGRRRETTVVTSLDKPPEILALHLKRSAEMYRLSWHH